MLLSLGVLFGVIALALYMWYGKSDELEDEYLPYGDDVEYENVILGGGVKKESLSEEEGEDVFLYFGSQTGTAEEFAETVAKGAPKGKFRCHVIDLEDFDEDSFLSQERVMFFVATYGEGDPTDNALSFHNWLTEQAKEKNSNLLRGMKYTVFGLGNTQYEYYNKMGKDVNRLLSLLGASHLYPYGEGDDDNALEEDFDEWKADLWRTMCENELGIELNDDEEVVEKQVFDFKVINFGKNGTSETSWSPPLDQLSRSAKSYFSGVECPVTVSRELRPSTRDGGSTLHMEIGISDTNLSYFTADNLAVLPENNDTQVESVASCFGFELDDWFKLVPRERGMKGLKWIFPTPCTVRTALQRYCDLNAPPKRQLLKELSAYATSVDDQQRLLHLSKDVEQYRQWITVPMRGLAEVIRSFVSLQMSLSDFLQICPRLQERFYTISSSSIMHPNHIHITASVVNDQLEGGRVFSGLCTNYLARLNCSNGTMNGTVVSSSTCRVFVRESTFRAPSDYSRPMIMVGPGTGIAPMRALLQDRYLLVRKHGKEAVGPTVLYYGCKRRDLDYIYEDELLEFQNSGALTQLRIAFSREQGRKVYVQHLLKNDAKNVWNLLDRRGGSFFVCGGASMGRDVLEVIKSIAQSEGGMNSTEANEYVHHLDKNGRYISELWS
eukprot:g5151.t1